VLRLPVELQALVDIHDQPFVLIDDQRRVVIVNRAFEESYGGGRCDLSDLPCRTLMGAESTLRPCGPDCDACPFEETFKRQVAQTSACSYRDAEGRTHILRLRAYPIRTESGRTYVGLLIERDALRHHPEAANEACPEAHMVGHSPAYRAALDRLLTAAGSEAPVLLLGETGTGKELAAAFIHRQSARRMGPFHTLDCSVLTEELFESEVFGHERGAFTGSVGEKKGLFELADKGTLFLDEIGELPMPLQAKLLRVLESGEFRRVGGTQTRRADVRVVCATNRDLLGGSWFRRDLYYRVACMAIRLPSLSERRSDIPLLASELLDRIGRVSARRLTIDTGALDLLAGYDFPGNIRELRNILWVASLNARSEHITAAEIAVSLPTFAPGLGRGPASTPASAPAQEGPTGQVRPPGGSSPRIGWDPDSLGIVLRRHHGNRRAVARELGVSERTVYRKLREFGLE